MKFIKYMLMDAKWKKNSANFTSHTITNIFVVFIVAVRKYPDSKSMGNRKRASDKWKNI